MEKELIYFSKIGFIKIKYEKNFITGIKMSNAKEENITFENELTKNTIKQLNEYFSLQRKKFDIAIKLNGTTFQKKVWNALLEIPYGQTKTYKQIAQEVGNSKASRAVGNANNKNPIAIVVPCHRVIGANNKLVGYAGGLEIKKKLLKLEQSI